MKTPLKLYTSQQATGDHTHRNHFVCADTKVSRKTKTKANKITIEKYNKKSAVFFSPKDMYIKQSNKHSHYYTQLTIQVEKV